MVRDPFDVDSHMVRDILSVTKPIQIPFMKA
jgi:hypothetical protein